MNFTESNPVGQMILASIARHAGWESSVLREDSPGFGESLGGELRSACWYYVPCELSCQLSCW